MITTLYRKIVPPRVRNFIYDPLLFHILKFFRNFNVSLKAKLIFIFYPFFRKTEQNRLFAFMGRYGATPYPYPYSLKYKRKKVNCSWDASKQMFYVMFNDRKLYFCHPHKSAVKSLFIDLLTEQDPASAHAYVDDPSTLAGYTLLDIGAAEGVFALTVIDYVEHVYLVECEPMWIKALEATFEPWKEKVTIIPKYAGELNEGNFITIDAIVENKSIEKIFLKMDIEGFERYALKGADKLLGSNRDIRCAVCVYHLPDDPDVIRSILEVYKFEYTFSNGYLFFYNEFRQGVIRGHKPILK